MHWPDRREKTGAARPGTEPSALAELRAGGRVSPASVRGTGAERCRNYTGSGIDRAFQVTLRRTKKSEQSRRHHQGCEADGGGTGSHPIRGLEGRSRPWGCQGGAQGWRNRQAERGAEVGGDRWPPRARTTPTKEMNRTSVAGAGIKEYLFSRPAEGGLQLSRLEQSRAPSPALAKSFQRRYVRGQV